MSLALVFNSSINNNNKGKVNSTASAVVASCYRQTTWKTEPAKHLANELP